MSQPTFEPEQLANEWAERITKRLQEINVPENELVETRTIIFAFTKTAVQELAKETSISLPYTEEKLTMDPTKAHQIIDLFLRGVNYMAKKLRDTGRPWDQRKDIMETVAWKLFNLAKLLVGFLYIPNPALQDMMSTPKDMQMMMKQSAESLLQEELTGNQGGLNFPRGQ